MSLLICIVVNVEAQEKGRLRIGLEHSYAFATKGGTLATNFEIKYNFTDKSNIGLRAGRSGRYSLKNSDISKKNWTNFFVTYDNYFHKNGSSSATFLGAGLGFYRIESYEDVEVFGIKGFRKVSDESKVGFMLRGGIELGKIRLVLDYNFVPIIEYDGGEIKNNYFSIGIGFYVGGGKWKFN